MSQNYLSSYKITNVLTDFVSLGLFFIPWSALPCSVPYGKDVAERLLHSSDTFNVLFFFALIFLQPMWFFFLPLLLILLWSLWFFVIFTFLLCLELQVPCNTPSPSSCFCFSNPCSCSQEKSRRDESPAVMCWEARGKPGARGGQSDRRLWWTTALRNEHSVNIIWKHTKNYNQRNWGGWGWKLPLNLSTFWTPHSFKIPSNWVKPCGPQTGNFPADWY